VEQVRACGGELAGLRSRRCELGGEHLGTLTLRRDVALQRSVRVPHALELGLPGLDLGIQPADDVTGLDRRLARAVALLADCGERLALLRQRRLALREQSELLRKRGLTRGGRRPQIGNRLVRARAGAAELSGRGFARV